MPRKPFVLVLVGEHREFWMLHRVFHIDAELMSDPRTGKPMCIPYCVNESDHSA